MSAAVFAEILVAGLQALMWVVLAIVAIFGVPTFDTGPTAPHKGWEPLLTALALATAYALGVAVDRIADWALRPLDDRIRDRNVPSRYPSVPKMRLFIFSRRESLGKALDYHLSRMRIARSTTVNAAMIGMFG